MDNKNKTLSNPCCIFFDLVCCDVNFKKTKMFSNFKRIQIIQITYSMALATDGEKFFIYFDSRIWRLRLKNDLYKNRIEDKIIASKNNLNLDYHFIKILTNVEQIINLVNIQKLLTRGKKNESREMPKIKKSRETQNKKISKVMSSNTTSKIDIDKVGRFIKEQFEQIKFEWLKKPLHTTIDY